jgi:hypothetical protein
MDKLQKAKQEKAESGWFPGTQAPLGYVIKKRKGKAERWSEIIPDPDKNKVLQVQLEFELRAAGLSYPSIHRAVLAQGFIPPEEITGYHFTSIEKRIKNPFYAGRFRWGGKEYDGRHELIVPPHVFRAAQNFLRRKPRSRDLRLSFLSCAECACAISFDSKSYVTASGERRTFSYYRCTNRTGFHASMKGYFVPENHVWKQIDALIMRIQLWPTLARKIAQTLNDSRADYIAAKKNEIVAVDCQMTALDRQEDQSLQALAAGRKTHSEFNEVRLDARGVRNRLLERSSRLHSEIIFSRNESEASIFDLADEMRALYLAQSAEEKIALVDLIYTNLRLRGPHLEADFKNPFRELMQVQPSTLN